MANAKISALPSTSALNDADELAVVQSGTTKKVQAQYILPAGVVDDTTIEVNSSVLSVKNNGITTAKIIADAVTLAKMNQSAMAHTIGFLSEPATNGAVIGSDVEVLDVIVSQNLMSTTGCHIHAKAYWNMLNSATGTGKIKIYDTDESILATITTEEMDIDGGNDYQSGMIEIDIYNNAGGDLAYCYTSYLIDQGDTPVTTMTAIYGVINLLLDSVASDEWHLRFYVNCSAASRLRLTFAIVDYFPYLNDN